MSSKLLVYGATGFVGGHIARTAVGCGLPTILAGRDAAKLALIAADLGTSCRAFGVADAAATAEALEGAAVVLNCAGPFKYTAEALAGACLRAGVPYLDITGEIPVFEALQAKDAEAKARGVMLLPAPDSTLLRPIAWRSISSDACRRRPGFASRSSRSARRACLPGRSERRSSSSISAIGFAATAG